MIHGPDADRFLIEGDEEQIAQLVRTAKRVAVLGMKTEAHAGQPAFFVPQYLAQAGIDVIPVPVYFPEIHSILGRPIYRTIAEIPGPTLDIVDVFRRPKDIPGHVEDLLAARPRAVWFQSGIRHDEAARRLAEAGILVVQDRCLMVDHRRYARAS
ncbi:CoA-binding protein [Vulgatibacter incomptus]|uniref:O-acetylhomoserine sulfhydrylase n=1 Tax=Vulgatibacter incomptus TaxID=1391653 RepID=A0A0K1P8E1_9BACT|nr:CoA-binding protein [Vulgatibacter incomptus]AKU89793.1 O-acetylhomoserine sulfhydrylase [Vulgatibacter incomptus]